MSWPQRDAFTGDGSTTTFTLTYLPFTPSLLVFDNGLLQASSNYSVAGLLLTFSVAPALGDQIAAVYYPASSPPPPGAGGVYPIGQLTDLASVKRYLNLTTTTSDAVLASLIPSSSDDFIRETGRDSFEITQYTEVRDGRGSDFMQLIHWPVQAVISVQVDSKVISASTGWNSRGYQFSTGGKLTLIGYGFTPGRRNVVVVYTAGYAPIAVQNEVQTIPAAAPFIITPQQPNWREDAGVVYFSNLVPLTPANYAPAAGQYYIVPLGQPYAGQYQFNAADAGKQLLLTYTYAGFPADIPQAVNEIVGNRYRDRDHLDVDSMVIGQTTTKYLNQDFSKHVWRVIKKHKRTFALPGF